MRATCGVQNLLPVIPASIYITFTQQIQKDLLRRFHGVHGGGVYAQFGVLRGFVGVADAGEFRYQSFTRLGVETLAVAGFADFERGGDVDSDEGAVRFDQLAHRAAGAVVGGDRGADGDAAVFGDFAGNKSDAVDVEIAVLFRESHFNRKIVAYDAAGEQRNRAAAVLDEFGVEVNRQCGLAGAGETGEEQGEPLLAAWRAHAAQPG